MIDLVHSKFFCVRVFITIFSSKYFRIVDYQLCHYTNPAQDLQYFLHTSPSLNLLENHSVLVEEYYNTLHSTLALLGYADLCPSLQQLHKQLDKLGRFAALIACTILPLFLADQINIPDLEKMLKEVQSVHFSERYKDAIKTLLPFFEQMNMVHNLLRYLDKLQVRSKQLIFTNHLTCYFTAIHTVYRGFD